MQVVVDIFYVLAFSICLFLVYIGCKQDIRNMSPLQKMKKDDKKKLEDETTQPEATPEISYMKEDPPSYNDIVKG